MVRKQRSSSAPPPAWQTSRVDEYFERLGPLVLALEKDLRKAPDYREGIEGCLRDGVEWYRGIYEQFTRLDEMLAELGMWRELYGVEYRDLEDARGWQVREQVLEALREFDEARGVPLTDLLGGRQGAAEQKRKRDESGAEEEERGRPLTRFPLPFP